MIQMALAEFITRADCQELIVRFFPAEWQVSRELVIEQE